MNVPIRNQSLSGLNKILSTFKSFFFPGNVFFGYESDYLGWLP